MNHEIIIVLAIFNCVHFSNTLQLPGFLKPCKANEPNFNECAVAEANKILPMLVKGYPPFNIPLLKPYFIPRVSVPPSTSLKLLLENIFIYGLDEAEILLIEFNFTERFFDLKFKIPNLTLQCDYDVEGYVLILPLNGTGPGNLTAVNGTYDGRVLYSLYTENNDEYAKIQNVTVIFKLEHLYTHLEDIVKDDKEYSDDTNSIINNGQWRLVVEELGPTIKETVGNLILEVCSGILNYVPLVKIFGGVKVY